MSTPPQEEIIAAWKAKYLEKGLPETLLDSMIAEAELEWEAVIGFGQINRLAWLNIKITDNEPNSNHWYMILVWINQIAFNGKAQYEKEYMFAQVPCVPLAVLVYRFEVGSLIPDESGLTYVNHSRDEDVIVEMNLIPTEEQCEKYVFWKLFQLKINELPKRDLNISFAFTLSTEVS